MKRLFTWMLAGLMVLMAVPALAQTSALDDGTRFGFSFDGLNTAETRAHDYEAGDRLLLDTVLEKGSISVTLAKDSGEVIYAGNGQEAIGFEIEIPEAGSYRLTVAGKNATGSTLLTLYTGDPVQPRAAMPTRLELLQSKKGYAIEYAPEDFDYIAGDTADYFVYKHAEPTESTLQTLTIERVKQSAASLLEELMQHESYTEQAIDPIDGHKAYSVSIPGGSTSGYIGYQYYVIETAENEALQIEALYKNGAENAVDIMEKMALSIHLTY